MIMRILLTAGVICLTSATGGDVRSVNAGTAGVEPRDLLGVLEKGYASAKSVLSDVRIVYAEEMSVSSDAAPANEATRATRDFARKSRLRMFALLPFSCSDPRPPTFRPHR
jgi:hypothetical protein